MIDDQSTECLACGATAEGVKRYKLDAWVDSCDTTKATLHVEMEAARDESGEWVRWEDYDSLRAQLAEAKKRVEELEKLERYNYEELKKLLADDGKFIITDEQIDKAWAFTVEGNYDKPHLITEPWKIVEQALHEAGIVATDGGWIRFR